MIINKSFKNPALQENSSESRECSPLWVKAFIPKIKRMLEEGGPKFLREIEEVRLRTGRPLIIRLGYKELTFDNCGQASVNLEEGYIVTREDVEKSVQILSQGSLYAWEEEFKNGYITIPGGHRVGLTGRGVLDKGAVRTLKEISGLNYRIGREIKGAADMVLPYVIKKGGVYHTLIISPPQCGKTTLLRDMVRQISDGTARLDFPGVNVGLIDERSEIAGMYEGMPQLAVGMRTDVLDACPKAQGMIMLIRSMSPCVVATDEIGKAEDVEALYQALQAGVSVLTTVHGDSIADIRKKVHLGKLLEWKFFERLIVLSRKKGPGTVEAVYNGVTMERMR